MLATTVITERSFWSEVVVETVLLFCVIGAAYYLVRLALGKPFGGVEHLSAIAIACVGLSILGWLSPYVPMVAIAFMWARIIATVISHRMGGYSRWAIKSGLMKAVSALDREAALMGSHERGAWSCYQIAKRYALLKKDTAILPHGPLYRWLDELVKDGFLSKIVDPADLPTMPGITYSLTGLEYPSERRFF